MLVKMDITNIVKGMDFPNDLWTVQPSAWNKVYKTSLFNEVNFLKEGFMKMLEQFINCLWYVKDYMYINKPLI